MRTSEFSAVCVTVTTTWPESVSLINIPLYLLFHIKNKMVFRVVALFNVYVTVKANISH